MLSCFSNTLFGKFCLGIDFLFDKEEATKKRKLQVRHCWFEMKLYLTNFSTFYQNKEIIYTVGE